MGTVTFVGYREPPSIVAGRMLIAEGLIPATSTRMPVQSLVRADALGILWADPQAKPVKYCWGLLKRPVRRRYLGTIWFESQARGATPTHWIFEACGLKHIDMLKQLAEKMATDLDVDIEVILVAEEADYETIFGEYDT